MMFIRIESLFDPFVFVSNSNESIFGKHRWRNGILKIKIRFLSKKELNLKYYVAGIFSSNFILDPPEILILSSPLWSLIV
jgi:hypothetical protein